MSITTVCEEALDGNTASETGPPALAEDCGLLGRLATKLSTCLPASIPGNYHCTGYADKCRGDPASCRRKYVREEALEAKFTELLGRLDFDDKVLAWVREALHVALSQRSGSCGPSGSPVANGMTKISCRGYHFPPEIIQQAIWLYVRFTLSLRDVEDLLAERGITVSYESIRRWVNYFGPMIAAGLRKRRPKPHATWHLDEVYLKIEGRLDV